MDSYSYYDEKRTFPRLRNALFVKYEIRTDLNNVISSGISTTRDISLGGMKLVCAAPVKPGYIVKLIIQLDKVNKVGVIATVVWVSEMRPGQYMIGLKFANLEGLDRQMLVKYVNSFAPRG